ncbi:flagellar basal body P-ring formation chaperone FlgA [Sphingosinithalassobacter sp. LHW66-3]|uniref:flagellar basal body P-ring formation chaperone FlgA n=1 Tax=Sphingosinithalassobacter sp. LHW66-3 TaxID=3424718 RepID=UPI003D6A2B63
MPRALLLATGLALALLPRPAAAQDGEVAVLDRAVVRGELLAAGDFSFESLPAAAARGALGADEAAGMEARRNLREGAVVRRSDVQPPQLVRRGEPVTIRVVRGAMVIATSGRALSNGGEGDLVRVVATSTNRTLDGIVDGSGSVRIAAP